MKITAIVFVFALFAYGTSVETDQAWVKALNTGANAKLVLQVTDSDGIAVEGADVKCWLWRDYHNGGPLGLDLTTDKSGICIVHGKCTGTIVWTVMKYGYYNSSGEWKLSDTKSVPKVLDGKWQPFGATHTIILKRIKRPGRLSVYSRKSREKRIPVFGSWVGFDLEMCDWVKPYGAGKANDVCLRFYSETIKKFAEYRYVMEVSFTNNPYGGAYLLQTDAFSDLKTAYEANTNMAFIQRFAYRQEKKEGVSIKRDYLSDDSFLVYRTRTSIDKEGRLKSGHYGMIRGPWVGDEKVMILDDGCFNPVPNDLSIEDGRQLRMVLKGYNK